MQNKLDCINTSTHLNYLHIIPVIWITFQTGKQVSLLKSQIQLEAKSQSYQGEYDNSKKTTNIQWIMNNSSLII